LADQASIPSRCLLTNADPALDWQQIHNEETRPLHGQIKETKMDWTKLLDVSMVHSVIRWIMTMLGGSMFLKDWAAGNPTEWGAIVAGAIALGSLIWSLMVVKANK
jgi:hypothetical protein